MAASKRPKATQHAPMAVALGAVAIADPQNANRGTARGRALVEQSIRAYGAARSIVVDRQGQIIAGHKTYEAAKAAGLEHAVVVHSDGDALIVVQRDDLDLSRDVKARELAIVDNRAGEVGLEWSPEMLRALQSAGSDLSAVGFTEGELATIFKQDGAADDALGGDVVPARRKTDIQIGDLFTLGRHRVLCGDSTSLEQARRVLGGELADMVFTDPPYGVNVSGKGGAPIAGDISFTAIPLAFDVFDKVLAPKAWCYVCGGQSNMALYSRLFERYFRQLARTIVWDKGKTAVMRHNGYHSCHEFVYFTFREGGGGRWYAPRDSDHADDIWRISVEDGGDERVHVTQKPVAVPARAIGNSCPPGGLVFEPFSGSGSTLIACEQLGRRCAAVELSPEYVQVVIDRWELLSGQKAVQIGSASLDRRRARRPSPPAVKAKRSVKS